MPLAQAQPGPKIGLAAWLAFCIAAIGLATASPSVAKSEPSAGEVKRALGAIQAKDQRLQDIGWRLVVGNAAFCKYLQPAIGLQLLDVAAFEDPDHIKSALGLDGEFTVQTVAAGSPAEESGLVPNAQVTAIDGELLSTRASADGRDWRRLSQIHDEIDAALAEKGQVRVAQHDGASLDVKGVPVCATRFELNDGGKRAVADGKRVQIGADFPAFGYPEDEFAAAIAHELAHNFLGHRAWLDSEGRKRKNVRMTEREADRLMPWLLANAGYDPEAALRFMQKWGPRHSGGIFRKRTHEGWDERAEHIAAELEGMQQFWNGAGAADWQQNFVREINAE